MNTPYPIHCLQFYTAIIYKWKRLFLSDGYEQLVVGKRKLGFDYYFTLAENLTRMKVRNEILVGMKFINTQVGGNKKAPHCIAVLKKIFGL